MRLAALLVASCVTVVACRETDAAQTQQPLPPLPSTVSAVSVEPTTPAYAPAIMRQPVPVDRAVEDERFLSAARAAWRMIEGMYHPATGLVNAQPDWAYPTTWDVASGLAAFYAARGLGFITDAEYKKRVSTALGTLEQARLYNGIAYGRNYDAKTGELVGPDQKPHPNGTGYSAIDVGRLLAVLAIIARQDPELADAAAKVAKRVDARRIVRDGYMIGEEIDAKTRKAHNYQEGRVGYEQYSASGFALWNLRVDNALKLRNNLRKANVLGIPVPGDRRGLDRLTSEPFILHGLELGFDPEFREAAWQTLAAQAQRYSRQGKMTMVSEDAISKPPYYFYYYCVLCSNKPFVVNVHSPGVNLTEPRWISTKAAYAWHALMPSKFTWDAIEAVQPALAQKGWATGVYEGNGKSTETFSLNTAAIILEATLYRKTGKPLIAAAR